MKRYALISVYNKEKIDTLAKTLEKLGVTILATGKTAGFLTERGIAVTLVEKISGNQEAFDGRIKTISFQIEAGILFERNNTEHVRQAEKLTIPQIDFVVCNFYPFWEKQAVDMIDVGGPTMVAAAAKNFAHVTVIVDPSDYDKVGKDVSLETRRLLAAKAFAYVADYDIQIADFFQRETGYTRHHFVAMDKGVTLRYGENPHQKGYFYQDPIDDDPLNLGKFSILQGKMASFNNLLDISAGLEAISLIGASEPACVILKHTNPCGAAIGVDLVDAFKKAWYDGDSLAAFGGIIIFNREVNEELAKEMLSNKKFFEIVAAAGFTKKALAVFAEKPKLQLWENKLLVKPFIKPYEDVKKIRAGYLVQDGDTYEVKAEDFKIVTKKKPTPEQVEDLLFAYKIAQVSKSNAVTAVKHLVLLSSGVGQQDRKRCAELCVIKAGKSLAGAVAATDGFFPFRDGPDVLIKAGIVAIAQPGGSIRDQEVIDACDEQDVAMVFTGVRNFRH